MEPWTASCVIFYYAPAHDSYCTQNRTPEARLHALSTRNLLAVSPYLNELEPSNHREQRNQHHTTSCRMKGAGITSHMCARGHAHANDAVVHLP